MKNTGIHIMSCFIYGGLVYRELLSYYIKKAKPHSSFFILNSSFLILNSSFKYSLPPLRFLIPLCKAVGAWG